MRFVWPIVVEAPRPYRGLGYLRPWRVFRSTAEQFAAPFGWRAFNVWSCHATVLLPLWLYWPVMLWRDRYAHLFRPLMALGFWAVDDEGGRYVEGRLTTPKWLRSLAWCFAHDADRSPDWAAIQLARWRARREAQRAAAARALEWLRLHRPLPAPIVESVV